MAKVEPTPRTWTLRFKHQRTTVLLHVDPLQKFPSVKTDLLKAIKDSHPNGKLNGLSVPDSADEVKLAKPKDPNDLRAGWQTLEPQLGLVAEDEGSAKGKGKAAASSTSKLSKNGAAAQDCPQAAKLRDGAVIAFKFKASKDEEWEKVGKYGEEDEAIEVAEDDAEEVWDVVVPTVEETYGEGGPLPEVDVQD